MPHSIQARVPDHIHRKLKIRAATEGLTISGLLLRELRKLAEEPTQEEIRKRLLSLSAEKRRPSR